MSTQRDSELRKVLSEMAEDMEKLLQGFEYCIGVVEGTEAPNTHWSALSSAAAAAEDDEEEEEEDQIDINMI